MPKLQKKGRLNFAGKAMNAREMELADLLECLEEYVDFLIDTAQDLYNLEGNAYDPKGIKTQRKTELAEDLKELFVIKLAVGNAGFLYNNSMQQDFSNPLQQLAREIFSLRNISQSIADQYQHVDVSKARKYSEKNNTLLNRVLDKFIAFLHKAKSLFGAHDGLRTDILRDLQQAKQQMDRLEP